jgi:hypothetical protein
MFRHLLFEEDSDFISKINWSKMKQVAWEIHPAFRSYILQLKDEDKARKGMSINKLFNRRF